MQGLHPSRSKELQCVCIYRTVLQGVRNPGIWFPPFVLELMRGQDKSMVAYEKAVSLDSEKLLAWKVRVRLVV